MKKLSPVIFVEAVEPCIAFWIDRLGFEKTLEVPEGDRIGFAAGNVEVMYQSCASVAQDIPSLAGGPFHKSGGLFIEVSDLAAIKPKLEGAAIHILRADHFLRRTGDRSARTLWNSGDIRRNDPRLIAALSLNQREMPRCCVE